MSKIKLYSVVLRSYKNDETIVITRLEEIPQWYYNAPDTHRLLVDGVESHPYADGDEFFIKAENAIEAHQKAFELQTKYHSGKCSVVVNPKI